MKKNVQRLLNVRLLAIWLVCLVYSGTISAQETMSVNFQNIPLEQAISQLQTMCGCYFIYNSALVNPDQRVSAVMANVSLSEILSALFKNTNIRFKVDDKQVILYVGSLSEVSSTQASQAESSPSAAAPRGAAINQAQSGTATLSQSSVTRGVVKDQDGFTLPGATILVKGTRKSTLTNVNGQFELQDVASNAVLVVSFLGYETTEVRAEA